jgi:hypothetical protein
MPEISRFYGIIIAMYHDDHVPPHFHVRYEKYKAMISIKDLRILQGKLPSRVIGLVLEWASLHREELEKDWELAMKPAPLVKIKPLI